MPAALVAMAAMAAMPAFGQVERDVVYVPTPPEVVEHMLDVTGVTPEDRVIDLGSGDGRIVIAAAKRGAHARGVDIDPQRIEESWENAREAGVEDDLEFIEGNIFEYDFSDATVVTLYLLENLNIKLRPTILDMQPGTRIVSHAFSMGDWTADVFDTVSGRRVHMWVVPAQVEGSWDVNAGDTDFTLELSQNYQEVSGTAEFDDTRIILRETALRGDEIRFAIDRPNGETMRFVGRVDGDRIEAAPETDEWEATRQPS